MLHVKSKSLYNLELFCKLVSSSGLLGLFFDLVKYIKSIKKHAANKTALVLTSKISGNVIAKTSESVGVSCNSPDQDLLILPISSDSEDSGDKIRKTISPAQMLSQDRKGPLMVKDFWSLEFKMLYFGPKIDHSCLIEPIKFPVILEKNI